MFFFWWDSCRIPQSMRACDDTRWQRGGNVGETCFGFTCFPPLLPLKTKANKRLVVTATAVQQNPSG